MKRLVFLFLVSFLFVGCSQNVASIDNSVASSSLDEKLRKQREASDAEVEKLEREIAKYEADKEKYSKDYETFNNNPILDEIDETLKEEESSLQSKDER